MAGIVLIDVVPDPDPVRVRRFLGSIGMDRTRDHLIDDILAAGSRLSKLLSSSGTPVHLVWATGSAIDADEVRRLQRSATGLGVTPIDTGHLVAAEAPTQLAEVIAPIAIAWLREMAARH